jgi:hypothetical protein
LALLTCSKGRQRSGALNEQDTARAALEFNWSWGNAILVLGSEYDFDVLRPAKQAMNHLGYTHLVALGVELATLDAILGGYISVIGIFVSIVYPPRTWRYVDKRLKENDLVVRTATGVWGIKFLEPRFRWRHRLPHP